MGRGAKSGIRVIYYWNKSERRVTFLEMYFKGDKVSEDSNRIR
jgi:mRNA-degrading endonuclease RelE of RelBE toxin-antitoxin system